jgi:WD40 repeat protein
MYLKRKSHYIENQKNTDYDKLLFSNNPNFKYKENICNDFNYAYWICDTFDVFYPSFDKKQLHLAYSIFNEKEIKILRISDKKKIKSLSGHLNFIDKVKIYYNEKDKNNYLLSSDWSYALYVWDLDNNYEIKHKIITQYTNYLYSFILYFKLDYIITSTVGVGEDIDYIKIFSFKDGKWIRNMDDSDINEAYFCLIWEKEKDINESYIIACCYEKVSIYNLINGNLYGNLITGIQESCGDYYYSGFISYDNKYLYTSSNEGYINIWDLYEKTLVQSIFLKDSRLYKIVPWSIYVNYSVDKDDMNLYENYNNYILVCDKNKYSILALNIIFRSEIKDEFINKIEEEEEKSFFKYEIMNSIINEGNSAFKMIKKIIHPVYGDSILCSDENKKIDLWINNKPIIIDIYNN